MAQQEGGKRTKEGWWILQIIGSMGPEQLAHKVVLQQHELTHLGRLPRSFVRQILPNCPSSLLVCLSLSTLLLCAQNNAKQGPVGPIGVQRCGQAPFEDLEVDFTEIGPSRGNKYLLGAVEAYPTCTEKAREVTKALLKDIIPRNGMPLTIGFDNGPAFVAEIVQQEQQYILINLETRFGTEYLDPPLPGEGSPPADDPSLSG
ncbi:hypothetical protein QTO34_014321, partial [Cnephaeus nilssonii]